MSDDRPAVCAVTTVVVVDSVEPGTFTAHLKNHPERLAVRRSKEKAVGMVVKTFPGEFGLPQRMYSSPSEAFGKMVLAEPEKFGVTIEDRTLDRTVRQEVFHAKGR